MSIVDEQGDPTPNKNEAIWSLVIQDMRDKDKNGFLKYGTRLQGFNGRSALRDAYQEVLDLAVYLRQAIWEQENPPTPVAIRVDYENEHDGMSYNEEQRRELLAFVQRIPDMDFYSMMHRTKELIEKYVTVYPFDDSTSGD